MGGCRGVHVEMEHTHDSMLFLIEWDHHKVGFIRFLIPP